MADGCELTARFFIPPPDLRVYVTTFYHIQVSVADGGTVEDHLHPEWANLRFASGVLPRAELPGKPPLADASFMVSGPTSTSMHFRVGTMRMWGVGLMPLGWAKFVRANAADHADTLVDGRQHPVYAEFAPLADTLFGDDEDIDAELARLAAHFHGRMGHVVADEARILACHEAIIDPDTHGVTDLAERAVVNQRTLERICLRHFGFPPKLLLRRQRFMRSLAQFLLDPRRKWIGSLDGQYHDQAQFVRDFRLFMGMTPRQYATREHPILDVVVHRRMQDAGAAVQAEHLPRGREVHPAGGAAVGGD